ncbi:MAG: response regulator [Lachnospiraceae bacterium]|nr:response regulator [Lachnospiraceae bacterium]
MTTRKVLFTSQKESFIVRVLIKKLQDVGIDGMFVPIDVDEIHPQLAECKLVAVYVEDDLEARNDVIHYLADALVEKDGQMVIIGSPDDIKSARDRIPAGVIYKTYARPVDNAAFVKDVTTFYEKVASGDMQKRIMIVDDDPQYLMLVRSWLQGSYKVYMANSGLQAIKMLGKNKVDLILLDHEMPVTSGPQVLEMLRSEEETSSIPVMFLTGKSDKESVMAVVALHPEGYFLKTIQKAELLKELKDFFLLQEAK